MYEAIKINSTGTEVLIFLGIAVWLDKFKTLCHGTQNTKEMDYTELVHR